MPIIRILFMVTAPGQRWLGAFSMAWRIGVEENRATESPILSTEAFDDSGEGRRNPTRQAGQRTDEHNRHEGDDEGIFDHALSRFALEGGGQISLYQRDELQHQRIH